MSADYVCECYVIGGPWITFDPECPEHGYAAQKQNDLAAALAASEARATRLQALLDERIELTGAAIIRAEATEQSLAEARALLRDEAALLRAWARESRDGGWSTHQVDPMNRRAAAIDALLPKGEGETS